MLRPYLVLCVLVAAGYPANAFAAPPVIAFTSPTRVDEGTAITIEVEVTDPDGDTPTWSWDTDFDATFGELPGETSYTIPAIETDGPDSIRVGVRATDGVESRQVYRTIVVDNVAPVVTSHPPTEAAVRREYRYELVVDDPGGDNDPLEVTVAGPTGMEVSGTSVLWTPTIEQRGRTFAVSLSLSDGDGGEATQSWMIEVARNAPPTGAVPVSPTLEENVPADEPVTFVVENANDPDGDPITYFFRASRNAFFEPPAVIGSGAVLEGDDGTTRWTTPDALDPGLWYWQVWVSDGIVETEPRHAHAIVGSGELPDGGAVTPDAGVFYDGSIPPPPRRNDDSGCSAAGGSPDTGLLPIGLAMLALAFWRRRSATAGGLGRIVLLGAAVVVATAAGCTRGSDDPMPTADGGRTIVGDDDDLDGISNDDEEARSAVDTDGDGTPDYLDLDSDNDGIADSVEAGDEDLATPPRDADRDGTPDFRDEDSDDNGIPDRQETHGDADRDGLPDYADLDDDNDLVPDHIELRDLLHPPSDADSDGKPNYQDPDSDDDHILDGDEYNADTDGDGLRDFEDLDSDNDGIPDRDEAGDADIYSPPIDTDGDTIPDFRDPDSDNDGLSDRSELERGTNPVSVDTDGDGVSDLIEIGAETDPTDPTVSPRTRGDFVFVVPYEEDPTPSRDTLRFRTSLQLVDVYFMFDISGSMSTEIGALRDAVTAVLGEITCTDYGTACEVDADCATGQACSLSGSCIDDPSLSSCVASPWTGGGIYEQDLQNLLSLQSDPSRTSTALSVSTFGGTENMNRAVWAVADPALAPGSPIGCAPSAPGRLGCPSFRADAVKILVAFSDEDSDGEVTTAQAATALQDAGITFIGVWSGTSGADAKSDMVDLAIASGSLSGAGAPLVFEGQDEAVVPAVTAAINEVVEGIPLRVTIDAADEPDDAGDALQFIDYLEVNTSAVTCSEIRLTEDTNGDGRQDAFPSLLPGTPVCWDVVPLRNDTVEPELEPQVFRARLTVYGDDSPLDSRVVYFLVPPYVPPPDIPD